MGAAAQPSQAGPRAGSGGPAAGAEPRLPAAAAGHLGPLAFRLRASAARRPVSVYAPWLGTGGCHKCTAWIATVAPLETPGPGATIHRKHHNTVHMMGGRRHGAVRLPSHRAARRLRGGTPLRGHTPLSGDGCDLFLSLLGDGLSQTAYSGSLESREHLAGPRIMYLRAGSIAASCDIYAYCAAV